MPLKRRGAGKRELYEPVSLHPFPGVFVFRGGDLCRVRFSGTPPAQGPGQIHPVVFLAVPRRWYWNCLGDVPVLQVEHRGLGPLRSVNANPRNVFVGKMQKGGSLRNLGAADKID